MSDKLSKVDDIVSMLDGMVGSGVGHINLSINEDQSGDTVETLGCTDCAKGNLACNIPTLHEGIDEGLKVD